MMANAKEFSRELAQARARAISDWVDSFPLVPSNVTDFVVLVTFDDGLTIGLRDRNKIGKNRIITDSAEPEA